MSYIIVGLGNPGEKYEGTRHNTGRELMQKLAKTEIKAKLVTPDNFMNNSGAAVKPLVKNLKQAEKLVVIHDDLDLPIGRFKISFNKSSGGHRGVESIIKNLKTQAFVRVRVGICPTTPSGKLKKPSGEKEVVDFILGKFKPKEAEILKKESKKILEAIQMIVEAGKESAMGEFN